MSKSPVLVISVMISEKGTDTVITIILYLSGQNSLNERCVSGSVHHAEALKKKKDSDTYKIHYPLLFQNKTKYNNKMM